MANIIAFLLKSPQMGRVVIYQEHVDEVYRRLLLPTESWCLVVPCLVIVGCGTNLSSNAPLTGDETYARMGGGSMSGRREAIIPKTAM